MTIERKSLITALEENIRKLITQNAELRDENKKIVEELNKSKQDLMIAHKNVLELQSEYDSLRIARTMAKTEEDIEFSQQRLSDLVREINKCIALLNQE